MVICENLDRDAQAIFWGLKFSNMLILGLLEIGVISFLYL